MGAREIAVARRQRISLDRNKVRAAIRTLPTEYVRNMLADAVDLLPPAKPYAVTRQYLDLRRLRPDGQNARANLLADVEAFEQASLAGDFYESFEVNSKNFMERSRGTTHWIAEFRRLLDCCVKQARKGNPVETCRAFDILFGLLDRLDEGRDDVVFFADEGGAWVVGADWKTVLPPWFKVLSLAAEPNEYARRITDLLERHCGYESARMLVVARKLATPAQRQALDRLRGTCGTER
jgi:hypothetical protein